MRETPRPDTTPAFLFLRPCSSSSSPRSLSVSLGTCSPAALFTTAAACCRRHDLSQPRHTLSGARKPLPSSFLAFSFLTTVCLVVFAFPLASSARLASGGLRGGWCGDAARRRARHPGPQAEAPTLDRRASKEGKRAGISHFIHARPANTDNGAKVEGVCVVQCRDVCRRVRAWAGRLSKGGQHASIHHAASHQASSQPASQQQHSAFRSRVCALASFTPKASAQAASLTRQCTHALIAPPRVVHTADPPPGQKQSTK